MSFFCGKSHISIFFQRTKQYDFINSIRQYHAILFKSKTRLSAGGIFLFYSSSSSGALIKSIPPSRIIFRVPCIIFVLMVIVISSLYPHIYKCFSFYYITHNSVFICLRNISKYYLFSALIYCSYLIPVIFGDTYHYLLI